METYEDGSKITCKWENGRIHGSGFLLSKDGVKTEADWYHDLMIPKFE